MVHHSRWKRRNRWHDRASYGRIFTGENWTISLGLRAFANDAARTLGAAGQLKIAQHLPLAAMVISIIPRLGLLIAAQKYFVRSMVSFGFKGV